MVVQRVRPGPAFSLLLAGILCLGAFPAAARDAVRGQESSSAIGAGIFHSFEIRAAPLRVNRKWARVRAAMDAERAAFTRCMADAAACATPLHLAAAAADDDGGDIGRDAKVNMRFCPVQAR